MWNRAVWVWKTRASRLSGVKDAMLPQLTAFVNMSNSGLAGQVNTLPVPVTLPNGQTQLIYPHSRRRERLFPGRLRHRA